MSIIERITDQNDKNKKGLFASNLYEQEKSDIETIRLLLKLSPGRYKLLQMIIKVAQRILSDCVIDPMTAASLARVLPVEDLSNLSESTPKKQQIIFGLEGIPSNTVNNGFNFFSTNTMNSSNSKGEQSSLTSMLDILEKWQAAWSYLVEYPEEFFFKDDQSFDVQTECFKRSLIRIFS
ncbi:hypothetical protein PIROE2DRAFT_66800 [Piromyces sp. E2]|nr:hypothetical protein PIROE2DRAFT_66800 [Piromyces sp. E2]|eukprot:OUM69586.1 hypothetical protein PIROE2DRAFT_66800 [Piromyces sp. E2]